MRHTFPQSNSVRDLGILQLGHDVCMEAVFFWLDLQDSSTFYSRPKIDMTAGRA